VINLNASRAHIQVNFFLLHLKNKAWINERNCITNLFLFLFFFPLPITLKRKFIVFFLNSFLLFLNLFLYFFLKKCFMRLHVTFF
jgi:hypothetical protein